MLLSRSSYCGPLSGVFELALHETVGSLDSEKRRERQVGGVVGITR